MSFVRPELRSFLWRWREGIGAGAFALLGLWFIWRGTTHFSVTLQIIGVVLALLGGAILLAALQRTRFRSDKKGPGVVEVTERQITYMGAEDGGTIALASLNRLEIRSHFRDGRYWVLSQSDGPNVHIPTSAASAERLFDAFAALPGIDMNRLVQELNHDRGQRVVIWRRTPVSALDLHVLN